MSETIDVAVGICTFRRPAGLRKLLSAVVAQQIENVAITIIVIDNDDEPTAHGIVAEFSDQPWPLIFQHQPQRGLVYARNALLDAVPDECGWLAFIDDDEIPVATWLQSLVNTAQQFDVPIVAGLVEPVFGQPPPAWVVEGEFFRRQPVADGTPTEWISTQNALIDMTLLRQHGWRFHMEFNRSGGEDEHFFQTALGDGCHAVVSQGALVHDEIPANRVRLSWMWRRNLRMGTTLSKIDLLRKPRWRVLPIRGAKSIARLAVGCFRVLTSPLRGKVAMVRGCLDVARACGAILGLFGGRLELYG